MFIVWIHLFSSESSSIPIFQGYPKFLTGFNPELFQEKNGWIIMFPGFVLKKCVLGLLVFPGSNLPFSWQKPAFFHPPHVFPERQAPPVASELPATGSRGVVRGPQRPTCGTLKPPRTPLLGVQNKKKWMFTMFPHERYMRILPYIGDHWLNPHCTVYIYIYPILAQNTKVFWKAVTDCTPGVWILETEG